MKHNKIVVSGMLAILLAFGLFVAGGALLYAVEPADLVGTTWVHNKFGDTITLKFDSATQATVIKKISGGTERPPEKFEYSVNGNTVTLTPVADIPSGTPAAQAEQIKAAMATMAVQLPISKDGKTITWKASVGPSAKLKKQ